MVSYTKSLQLLGTSSPATAALPLDPNGSQIGNSFPDPFFHSRIPGNVDIHSRDSRAPGNDVYCSSDRLFPGQC